ncbi:MAG: hypothetical protein HY553_01895, partial [Elusimicrobia bacterium]|nr:hypothetical protein [Elusimicrobiota bacterium]
TSATFTWSIGANPAGTLAEVEVSTDGTAFRRVALGALTAFTATDLSICLPTIARVRLVNGDGIATEHASPASFTTQSQAPLPPGGFAATSLAGNVVAFQWTPSPSEGVTGYRLYFDAGTGSIDYILPLASFPSTSTAYTSGVLVSSPSYRFGLRASNRCGVEEENTGVLATAASLNSLTGVRASIKVPETGKSVNGNRVTVVADIVLGDDAQTRRVLFQYRAHGASAWTDVPAANANHPNPDTSAPWVVHWDVTRVAPGPYELRAVAMDFSGAEDAAPSAITITVDPVDPDIEETSLGGGNVEKKQEINNGANSSVKAADEGSTQVTEVVIPAGALTDDTVTVTVVNNPVDVPPVSRLAAQALATDDNVFAAGSYVEITLSNGQSALSAGKAAPLTISYTDADGNGIVDGTQLRAADLQIWVYDPATAAWKRDFGSTVDTAKKTVTGATPHFSLFGLFGPQAQTPLSNVQIFPVPFKPNGGNPDEGRPFSAGDPNSGVVFNNLPQGASVTIYTASGRRVKRLDAGTLTRLQWDARNDDGRDVASGGYIAVITAPGQITLSRVIAIIR